VFDIVHRELAKTTLGRVVALIWIGLLAGGLVHAALFGGLIVDNHGRPLSGDFLAFWSAGQMVASGHAAAAYDPEILHRLQIQDSGQFSATFYPWDYPPLFLFVAFLLAQLPYAAAYVSWAVATLAGYGACAKTLFRDRDAAIAYGAAPACFAAFIIAQTGLLTAALFGAALLTLNKRPIVSGLLLAALAYKPQFGLLIPVALIAGGHWRTILAAALASAAWILVWLLIDKQVFAGFAHALVFASQTYLTHAPSGWHKLQSLYGLLRTLGLDNGWAGAAQGIFAAASLAAVAVAWRSRLSVAMKSAILVICSLIATPYSFIYDFPILSVAVGFLYRDRAFDRFEQAAVWSAYALTAAYLLSGIAFGMGAVALIAAVAARRIGPPFWAPPKRLMLL
jgi:hypothetical protein